MVIGSARLVEMTGDLPSWHLDCTIPLLEVEGEALLALLVPDGMESPPWECGSLGSGRDE